MSPDEYFEDDDTVVVLGHSAIKKDGQSATTAFVHVWRWRGDQISRFQLVTDTLQLAQMLALAASGTPEKNGAAATTCTFRPARRTPTGTSHQTRRSISSSPPPDSGSSSPKPDGRSPIPQHPPAPGDVARLTAVAARYGYTMGTPEENAAVGIEMPKFAVGQ